MTHLQDTDQLALEGLSFSHELVVLVAAAAAGPAAALTGPPCGQRTERNSLAPYHPSTECWWCISGHNQMSKNLAVCGYMRDVCFKVVMADVITCTRVAYLLE